MAHEIDAKGYDYIEFYVGSAKMFAYWMAKTFSMEITAYKGPETGHRDRCSYYLKKVNLHFVVTSALRPETDDVAAFVRQHGDGVKRWAMKVENVKECFASAVKNGGIPIQFPTVQEDKNGVVEEASIRLYDDTELMLIDRSRYNGLFRPGYDAPMQDMNIACVETGLCAVDHIVGNVRENEMNHWADYFNKAVGFETLLEFGPGDITTKYSALLSKVVRSKNDVIKNPINEPYEGVKKSQIEEFLDEYRGSGIQHIAIATPDIIAAISAMRENGIDFLRVPDRYYDNLRERNADRNDQLKVTEDIDVLQKHGILCDLEGEGYLLQLFTKPIGDRPTFFFEIIQRRKGASGFGQGNFQALFESIEIDQERRGNLVDSHR